MKLHFSYIDLKQRRKGEKVEISLEHPANVRLMTPANFQNFKNGRRHQY